MKAKIGIDNVRLVVPARRRRAPTQSRGPPPLACARKVARACVHAAKLPYARDGQRFADIYEKLRA